MEIGTGSGYGVERIAPHAEHFLTIDKHAPAKELIDAYPNVEFRQMNIPPLVGIESESVDCVISFQVIEHIKRDEEFVREVHRVLKKGGKFIVSTPNRPMSLTRNPWHVREYTAEQFSARLSDFADVEALGVAGNERVWSYYEKNRESVERITRFDIFRMQWWMPRWVLQIPYDILNRLNRRRLHSENRTLTENIAMEDYSLQRVDNKCFDLFYVATK